MPTAPSTAVDKKQNEAVRVNKQNTSTRKWGKAILVENEKKKKKGRDVSNGRCGRRGRYSNLKNWDEGRRSGSPITTLSS